MSLLSETALPPDSETFTADELNEGQEPAKKTGIFSYAWMPLKSVRNRSISPQL
jgi:hypothetical protein